MQTTNNRLSPKLIRRANQQFAEQAREEQERIGRFGKIRAPISAVNWNRRIMVVRDQLLSGDWRFFPDFLRDFGSMIFGRDWYNAELPKPDRHPLLDWRAKATEFMKKQGPAPDGTCCAIPSGYLAACMTFDYDLYVVADNNMLDDTLLSRLKNRDQFQGARHELFAEATCLRAGFTIAHENERDGTLGRHVEFVATHKATGQQISVEAKSKHGKRCGFGRLINDAVKKGAPHPLAVFLDTNLPVERADRFFEPRSSDPFVPSKPLTLMLEQVRLEAVRLEGETNCDPYNLLVFTNHPHQYGADDEIDQRPHLLTVLSEHPRIPAAFPGALADLHHAAKLYGNIPNAFPDQR